MLWYILNNCFNIVENVRLATQFNSKFLKETRLSTLTLLLIQNEFYLFIILYNILCKTHLRTYLAIFRKYVIS